MSKKSNRPRGAYNLTEENLEQLGTGGIHLRQWRVYRDGMTAAKLAELSRLSIGTINGIENGKNGWGPVTLHKLAGALKTTPAGLLGVNPLTADPDFLLLWDRATPLQRQRIKDHAIGVVGPIVSTLKAVRS